jgi:hypothetical protein
MESQLINPPPSPTCVESHCTVTSTFPNNSFNDIMGQLMNQLGHEVDIMKCHQITSNPLLTSISYALAQSAMEKNRTPVKKKDMKSIPLSPHFIKMLSEHLTLGSFPIEELLANRCHNIQEILSQAHSYALTT